jgi:hypothetical protein
MTEPATALTPARFEDTLPRQQISYVPSSIRVEPALPPGPARKFAALRQKSLDLHAVIPAFHDVQEAQLVVTGHKQRIADLTKHPSVGGYGLSADAAPQVISERKLLDRAIAELHRLEKLRETRSARWTACGRLERAVSDWLGLGLPRDCVIEAVDDAPVAELLKKGERIADAVNRYRSVLERFAGELQRVRTAPHLSAVAKAVARDQINALADAAAPDAVRTVKSLEPVGFATARVRALALSLDPKSPPPLVHAEIPDAVGLVAWLWRDQLISKITPSIDEAADDRNALSESRRQEMEAQLGADMLAAEFAECSLIWHADAAGGEIIDFRSDTMTRQKCVANFRASDRSDAKASVPKL